MRIWRMLILILSIIIIDQITKGLIQNHMTFGQSIAIIDGFFNLTYVKNSGAAFGMGANAHIWLRRLFFLLLPAIACFWLCLLIWYSRKNSIYTTLSYSLILGGAIGNLIDRFLYGHVVDFLEFYFRNYHFPSFNVADSSITIGGVLLFIDFVLENKKNRISIVNSH